MIIQHDFAGSAGMNPSLPQPTERILRLKERILSEERFMSVEQARLITESYQRHPEEPRVLQRAHALAWSLRNISIRVDPGELIVGNRTAGIREGVVSPEAGLSWLARELESLPNRPQDPFAVREEDAAYFREVLHPFWSGKTLEDIVESRHGEEIRRIKKVVKINQTDHAQGHILPNVEKWLRAGPLGLAEEARSYAKAAEGEKSDFLNAAVIVLEASADFIRRYADLAGAQSDEGSSSVAEVCAALAHRPPESFREALQSLWFLFVILQMESNASSFSPGRMDQYLWPYLQADLENGRLERWEAQELIDALWLNFNKIVYMRSASSAQYFAGFPIGFNVSIGGVDGGGKDAVNELSMMLLKAQEHIGLPQPNLTARLWSGSPDDFVNECARVIGLGSGMPQIVNDESIIPSLMNVGIERGDARNYGVVGCVELSTPGNNLGWSDAAMFNLVKVLELTLNDGVCLLTGRRLGPESGPFAEMENFDALRAAYKKQIDYFLDAMIPLCDAVDRLHAEVLPSPFLSAVIDDCVRSGVDVTAGGAKYNLSGIQLIQVANVADSLAVLERQVFGEGKVKAEDLLAALRRDFHGSEFLRQTLIHKTPKYGNDVEWVDRLGAEWVKYFASRLAEFENARGGPYQMGLYTVSAHVPMGKNVGATPDGRRAGEPLADGGMSAVSGRDVQGPTALLQSVARMESRLAGNGTLLNMKFLPRTFSDPKERSKFIAMLRAFIALGIHHVQFNVVNRETLLAAKADPQRYRNLPIRVAGYTAYFIELAEDLQDEIIARTSYGF